MTTLENFYFGNVNPSEYRQSKETKKKISEMTELLDELKDLLTTEQQKEKLEQIDNCQDKYYNNNGFDISCVYPFGLTGICLKILKFF